MRRTAVTVPIRLVAIALLGLATFGSSVGAEPRAAGTQASNGIFALSARADGLGLEFVATGLPVVPQGKLAFLSPASTQATLDQFSGTAYASAPYPGDLLVSLPTTVNGLGAGTLPPFPAYPFYVATDSATPDDREEVGPYLLAAHSEPNDSNAHARIGLATSSPQAVSVTADAAVRRNPDTGLLTAEAITSVAPIRINDLLSLGEITSTAQFSYDPSTPEVAPVKSSSLSVGTITIAGIQFGLTDRGLVAAGNPLLPVDASALTGLLAGSGVTIELLPAVETDTAISSSAVQITYNRAFPTPFGDTTVRLVLGRSSATLTTGRLPARPTPTTAPTPATAPAAMVEGGGVSAPAATPSSPIVTPSAPVAAPVASPAAATPAATTSTTGAPLADFHLFYLALVGGALLAMTSSRLVQWLTFRLRLAPAPQLG